MTFNEIETAIGQRLEGMTDCPPIAWPNKDYDPKATGALPYVEFRHVPSDRLDETTDGNYPRQIGLVLLTVITARDQFTAEANSIAQDIADRFPKALRMDAGSGKVLINRPASLATPFVDGVYWRQPVRISYVTEG